MEKSTYVSVKMEKSNPSTSFGEPNFAETLLKWYEGMECDDGEEEEEGKSDHDTEIEFEESDNEDEIPTNLIVEKSHDNESIPDNMIIYILNKSTYSLLAYYYILCYFGASVNSFLHIGLSKSSRKSRLNFYKNFANEIVFRCQSS